MGNNQLELDGIGQQLAKLSDWKKENNIFTHNSMVNDPEYKNWSCWDEIEGALDFMDKYGYDAIALAHTEKEAIIKFCTDNDIKLPFWW